MSWIVRGVSKERWVNNRWKPTVIPRPVRLYMISSRPRSVQWNPRPHSKNAAAITPSKGMITKRTVISRLPNGAARGVTPTSRFGIVSVVVAVISKLFLSLIRHKNRSKARAGGDVASELRA